MLHTDSNFLRTPCQVGYIREYLSRTQNAVPGEAIHPAQNIAEQQKAMQADIIVDVNENSAEKEKPKYTTTAMLPGEIRAAQEKEAKLQKVLSHKALKIGTETGITAEFIVTQTGEQLAYKLEDLFLLFDTFQDVLYANDPAINAKSEHSS